MNYIITGGIGLVGTHLTNLILAEHPEAKLEFGCREAGDAEPCGEEL